MAPRTPDLPDLGFRTVSMTDPLVAPMLQDLQADYDRRYETQANAAPEDKEINAYPAEVFEAPTGAFVALLSGEEVVAGGAIMCKDWHTAEFKRIWTSPLHRGKGLAKYLLHELERRSRTMGYTRVFLTTGPSQPEAVALYLHTGYEHGEARDLMGDGSEHAFHAFTKDLTDPDGAGGRRD